jgi:LCP family protein required for cell wall assembly
VSWNRGERPMLPCLLSWGAQYSVREYARLRSECQPQESFFDTLDDRILWPGSTDMIYWTRYVSDRGEKEQGMPAERTWKRAISTFLTVTIIAGAMYSGFFFFSTVRAVVAQMDLPFAERIVQAAQPGEVSSDGPASPATVEEYSLPEATQLEERLNVLLLGIDQREGEKGPWRTDTMILLSLDPVTNSASMLSIPRDLWTTIPGYGESRINTAHFTGDDQNYPGGGPALAKKTVWYALGVPVHNYVRVNFTGFEQLIDAVGGLDIEVPEDIYDAKYPTADYGTIELFIPAGLQHMDGKLALQYARTRHGSSDFARMGRQQQVLRAAFDKALSLDIPLTRIPMVLQLLGTSVQTDLTLQQIVTLVGAARKIGPANLRSGVIDGSITTTVVTPQGWMVEVADWDKVRALVDDLFPTTPVATPTNPSSPAAGVVSEQAQVAVYNGTLSVDLAQATAALLSDKGYVIAGYNSADRFDHAETLIVVYHDKPLTAAALAEELGVAMGNVIDQPTPNETVDIAVILGQDYLDRQPAQ